MARPLHGHSAFLIYIFFLGFVFFVPFDSLHPLPGILSTFTFISSFDNFGSELIGRENMSFSNLPFGP